MKVEWVHLHRLHRFGSTAGSHHQPQNCFHCLAQQLNMTEGRVPSDTAVTTEPALLQTTNEHEKGI